MVTCAVIVRVTSFIFSTNYQWKVDCVGHYLEGSCASLACIITVQFILALALSLFQLHCSSSVSALIWISRLGSFGACVDWDSIWILLRAFLIHAERERERERGHCVGRWFKIRPSQLWSLECRGYSSLSRCSFRISLIRILLAALFWMDCIAILFRSVWRMSLLIACCNRSLFLKIGSLVNDVTFVQRESLPIRTCWVSQNAILIYDWPIDTVYALYYWNLRTHYTIDQFHWLHSTAQNLKHTFSHISSDHWHKANCVW